jgi:hypothetical protein
MGTTLLKWEGVALCTWTHAEGTVTTATVAAEAICIKTTTTTCTTMVATGEKRCVSYHAVFVYCEE